MSKNFKWNEKMEGQLKQIVTENRKAGKKKWNEILNEFNTAANVAVTIPMIQNKWNNLKGESTEAKKAKKLLKGSSGMGMNLNMMDPRVYAEFLDAHPALQNTDVKPSENVEQLENKRDFLDEKKCDYSPVKKKGKMSEYETRVLSIMAKEFGSINEAIVDPLMKSIEILEEMNLSDEQYLKAVDVLSRDNNAKKFMFLPIGKRELFIMNKLSNADS